LQINCHSFVNGATLVIQSSAASIANSTRTPHKVLQATMLQQLLANFL
jgi:hypothetical protein